MGSFWEGWFCGGCAVSGLWRSGLWGIKEKLSGFVRSYFILGSLGDGNVAMRWVGFVIGDKRRIFDIPDSTVAGGCGRRRGLC